MTKITPLILMTALLCLPLSLLSHDNTFGGMTHLSLQEESREQSDLLQANDTLNINNDNGHRPGRFSFKIGGGFHYVESEIGNITSEFDKDGLAFLANAQLAIRYSIRTYGEDKDRGSAFGLFGRYGFLSDMGTDGDFPFYEIEAGWVLREWIRVSGGIGNQDYNFNGESMSVSYYTGTAGIVLRFGQVELDFNLTSLFDENFDEDPSFRANATLNIHFRVGGR